MDSGFETLRRDGGRDPFNSIEWILHVQEAGKRVRKALSIPLNGFLFCAGCGCAPVRAAFNSIEWIQGSMLRRMALFLSILSIPLNGFGEDSRMGGSTSRGFQFH